MKNFTSFHEHLNNSCYVSKKQLLILIALCLSVLGYSQTFQELDNNNNTLEFNIISATEVEVKDYISGGTDIDIPSTVDNPNDGITYNITSIGVLAFLNNALTSVVLPNSISSINTGAFQGNSLTSITIPDGVTLIANNAFFNNQIANLIIPNSVTNIGNNAFQGNSIQNLSLGNGLTTIGNNAFLNNPIPNLTIPSSVTSIGSGAFISPTLACVISESTTPPTINTAPGSPADTFSSIRGNIDLSIPSGTANDYATASWTGFNSVSEGLTGTFVVDNIEYQINPSPFNEVTVTDYNTAGGTVVNIPETVTSACTTFTVTDIGNSAFQNKGLTALTLPNTLEYIGVNAFFINNLTSVTIPDSVITIDDIAFAQNNNLTNLVLGSNLVSLGGASFRFTALTTVTIPASVTNIGVVAFGGLSTITDVFCEGSVPPTIGVGAGNADTFNDPRGNIHLHIPAGTMGAYVTDPGALWTGFNPVSEDALSIADFELENTVKVITSEGVINVIANNNAELQQFEVYELTGKRLATGQTNQIKTNGFAKGIYILKLDFDKGTVVKKVVVN